MVIFRSTAFITTRGLIELTSFAAMFVVMKRVTISASPGGIRSVVSAAAKAVLSVRPALIPSAPITEAYAEIAHSRFVSMIGNCAAMETIPPMRSTAPTVWRTASNGVLSAKTAERTASSVTGVFHMSEWRHVESVTSVSALVIISTQTLSSARSVARLRVEHTQSQPLIQPGPVRITLQLPAAVAVPMCCHA